MQLNRCPQINNVANVIRSIQPESKLTCVRLVGRQSILDLVVHNAIACVSTVFSACVAVVAVVVLGSPGGASTGRGKTAEGGSLTVLGCEFCIRFASVPCSCLSFVHQALGRYVLPAASTQSP